MKRIIIEVLGSDDEDERSHVDEDERSHVESFAMLDSMNGNDTGLFINSNCFIFLHLHYLKDIPQYKTVYEVEGNDSSSIEAISESTGCKRTTCFTNDFRSNEPMSSSQVRSHEGKIFNLN